MTTRIRSTVERLLVRTWNLFHGNTLPPGRKAFLRELVRLASSDRPDVLCLQEVPVWAVTELDHGLLRSAFTGQANGILLGPELRVVESRHVILNPLRFRRAQARRLGLGLVSRLAWGKERRVLQAVRVRRGDETLMIANTP